MFRSKNAKDRQFPSGTVRMAGYLSATNIRPGKQDKFDFPYRIEPVSLFLAE